MQIIQLNNVLIGKELFTIITEGLEVFIFTLLGVCIDLLDYTTAATVYSSYIAHN